VLKDAAMQFVQRLIPPPARGRRVRELRRALMEMCRRGITSVHDMNPSAEDVAVYAELAERGELAPRIYAAPLETEWFEARQGGGADLLAGLSPRARTLLRSRAVKGFSDGSLGSRTAYFFEPYADEPGNCGLLSEELHPLEQFAGRLGEADRAGRQLCMHAIGDRAVSIMLDVFGRVLRANGARDRRWRIEHAQHAAAADFDRFRALGVIASVQPYHLIDDGRWAAPRIGEERLERSFAFRTFLDHGVRLAIGTDWPVAPLDPMLTLYAAVTRATLDGLHPGGWVPSQRISLHEALQAYTAGGAFAEGAEHEKGTLTPGKFADLVVLSEDVLHLPPSEVRNARVDLTIVGGQVVYEAES
jgi:predicted amidohydrolase YtcJ